MGASGLGQGVHFVRLKATLFHCRQNATVESPLCEQQILQALLRELEESRDAAELRKKAGEGCG